MKRILLTILLCTLTGVLGYKGGMYLGSEKSDAVMTQIEQAAYTLGQLKMAQAFIQRCETDHQIGGKGYDFHYYCAPVKKL